MRDSAVRRWSAIHRAVYRLTRGIIGRRLVGNDILLLTTTNRSTGRPHTVPLLYLRDSERLVVIASYGGRPSPPSWFRDLLADDRVQVQIGGRRRLMRARAANPTERSSWWPRAVAAYDGYVTYQSRTTREIPVVFLTPDRDRSS